jgi:hypothetical protein
LPYFLPYALRNQPGYFLLEPLGLRLGWRNGRTCGKLDFAKQAHAQQTLAKRVALAVFAASATFAAFAIFAAVARGKGATLQPAQCQRYHRHGVAGKNTANPWLKLAQLAAGRRALFGKDQHQLAP